MTLDELIEGIGVTVNSSGGGCGNKKTHGANTGCC